MPSFERGAIVRVPFPYTNRPIEQFRPALVVSSKAFSQNSHLLWVLMITSASNRRWPGDNALVEGHSDFGLPAPSLIRTAKMATVEAVVAEPIGQLPATLLDQVDNYLRNTLAL